jgi:hypothetical protein
MTIESDDMEKVMAEALTVKEALLNALMLTTLIRYRENP